MGRADDRAGELGTPHGRPGTQVESGHRLRLGVDQFDPAGRQDQPAAGDDLEVGVGALPERRAGGPVEDGLGGVVVGTRADDQGAGGRLDGQSAYLAGHRLTPQWTIVGQPVRADRAEVAA